MPNLVKIKTGKDRNSWPEVHEYLPHATFHRERWTLGIETEYPYVAHALESDDNVRMLKNIRMYIERYGIDDVLYRRVNKDYKYCWNVDKAKYIWDEDWSTVSNTWWKFYFGSENDLNMLFLKYNGILHTTIPKYRPGCEWHNETNTKQY